MSKSKTKILIAESLDFSRDVYNYLSEYADVYTKDPTKINLGKDFTSYDIFWFRLGFKIDKKLIETPERRVSIVVCPVTGLDHIDVETCEMNSIKVLSLKGETIFLKEVRATAELTIGLILNLLRNLPAAIESVKNDIWNRDLFRGYEIYGKTVGIIGMGRLGTIVSEILFSFGAKVIGFDIKKKVVKNVKMVDSLIELVRSSNIVSVHIDYNEKNHHVLDGTFFSAFNKNSIFINTSRGALVDEKALLDSLLNGHLIGAAVDVIDGEHNHDENKLIKYAKKNKNLLISPHIGGSTYESFKKTEQFLARKLVDIIS
jgi:D-3-phosphoglycerate dehydrogenase / 2-oxoglutarate reductase